MEKGFVGQTLSQVVRACVCCVLFCLLAEALFAVFIRAFAPSYPVITAINWGIECVGVFFTCFLLIRRDRALFKGMIAGALSAVLSLLLFGAIGGGIHLTAFFLLKLVLCAAVGGLGGFLGANCKKE
jgi:putative membrane protein (TIGR04086 family)